MMLAGATVVSVFIINLHHRGVYGLPASPFVKRITLVWLASLLMLRDRVEANCVKPNDVTDIKIDRKVIIE